MKQWLLPTLGAFICFGGCAFIPKLSAQYLSPKSALVYQVIGAMIVAIFVFSNLDYQLDIQPKGILLAVLAGVLEFIGILLYLKAASTGGQISVISTVSALYPVIATILALIFLGESLTGKQFIGILLALSAMVLIAG